MGFVEPIPPVVTVPPIPGDEPKPLPVLDPKLIPELELVPLPESVPPVVAGVEVDEPLLPKADPELPKDEDEEPNPELLLLPKEDPEDPNAELPPPGEDPAEPKEEEEPKELFETPPAPLVIPVGVMPFCCICTCCRTSPWREPWPHPGG